MNLNDVFIEGINNNRLSFYKTAKAILQNEDDIEDAIQDALETGYKNLDTLKEPKYFKTWMTRILINKCYDILRKKSKIVPTEDELLDNNSDGKDYTGTIEIIDRFGYFFDNSEPYYDIYMKDSNILVKHVPQSIIRKVD